jgi:hypothetical protein
MTIIIGNASPRNIPETMYGFLHSVGWLNALPLIPSRAIVIPTRVEESLGQGQNVRVPKPLFSGHPDESRMTGRGAAEIERVSTQREISPRGSE